MLPFFFQLLDAIFDLGKIFKIESIDLRTFFANFADHYDEGGIIF